MEGFEKTELGLNIITNNNVVDVDPIMENFTLVENKIKKNEKDLENIELTDVAVKITNEAGEAIDQTLKDVLQTFKNVQNQQAQELVGTDAILQNSLGIYEEVFGIG